MTTGRMRLLQTLAVLLFLFLFVEPFVHRSLIETWSYLFHDFPMFYEAASRIRDGENPYPPEVLTNPKGDVVHRAWEHYLYPPAFAAALIPLTWMDELNAKRVFVVISLLLYFGAMLPAWSESGRKNSGWIAALAILLVWGPSVETLRIGQSNLVPFAFLAAAYWVLRRVSNQRDWIAGALAGAGAVIKLTPLLMVPLFLAGRRWRVAAGMVAGFVGALMLSGPSLNWVYFTQVAPTLGNFHELRKNHSIQSVLLRGFDKAADGESAEWAAWAALLLSGFLFLLLVGYVVLRQNRLTAADLLLVGCYAHTLFAGKWSHHYVTLALPLAALALELGAVPWRDWDRYLKWGVIGLVALFIPHAYYWPPAEWVLQWNRWTQDFYNPVAMVSSATLAFPIYLYLLERSRMFAPEKDGGT